MDEILLYADSFEHMVKTFKVGLLIDLIVFFILTFVFFKLATAFTTNLKQKLKQKKSEVVKFIPTIDRTIKSLILFFMIATLLQSHGYSMNSFIAGFGITGLAIGFAAKETIANFFGIIAIASDKSYKLGDTININGLEGTVEDINMRSTKIRAYDNKVIIIPNSTVASAIITNVSQIKKHRLMETIALTHDTSDENIRKAMQIVKDILEKQEEINKDYCVYFGALSADSIDIKVRAYVKTKDGEKFIAVREEIFLEIIKEYRAQGINFALPSQSIYVEKLPS